MDIIAKRGAFFAFGDTRLGQGRENAKESLKQDPELLAQIEAQIRASAVQHEAIVPIGDSESDEDEATESDELTTEEAEAEAVSEAV
jgi:recombination protein RecA